MPSGLKSVAIGAAIATTAAAGLAYFWYSNSNREEPIPTKWKQIGKITEINTFPIKSCAPIKKEIAICDDLGLGINEFIHDRVFMITKTDKHFVTGRTYPKLLLIKPSINRNILTLTIPDGSTVDVNVEKLLSMKTEIAQVWQETIESVDAGDEVAKFISKFILETDEGLRLVLFPKNYPTRHIDKRFKAYKNMRQMDSGALVDKTAYVLINQASIDDLNSRIENSAIKPLQFRPNIVVDGPDAYAEDKWDWIRIGDDVVFRTLRPCTRCIFININPETAERHSQFQPLKQLKEYRSIVPNDSPVMGIHIGLRKNGKFKIGEPIYIAEVV